MTDVAQMWITAVPPFGEDDVGVLVGIDIRSDDPGQRLVAVLMNRGHEGEEGVFYLLPDDLSARYERTGDRLAVRLLARPEVVDQDLAGRDDALRGAVAGLPREADGWISLLRREIETDFVPDAGPDGRQPVLLIDHAGPAPLAELFAAFAQGEASFAVVNAFA
ncbi:hypothetical protein V6U90_22755 [Micromonospora sp. CPCC 206060]|uniref:hypothetical protein n=1 Tax=Micromonospora sp. CPCC 206060 TaxID=3122406 RepID=UPI002FEF0D7E